MLLDRVTRPRDLRDLDTDALARLAGELRDVIVRTVAARGGHLGSNLGAVELTIALHRTFDSPFDVILWDTGHQAYAHKLLTGRAERMPSLRAAGGISGYPSRAESPHDWVENSHASTAVSWAHGMATALRGSGRRVVAVLGDGALTGGMAYEGLSNIGHTGTPCVIVLNDNGRSYAPTASALTAEPPDEVSAQRVASFVRALGLKYVGLVDGHDIAATEAALAEADALEQPVVVHVRTTKGRGYGPAEEDEEKRLHDTAKFDVATGPTRAAATPVTYTEAFGAAMLELARRDPRVHAVTAAMPGPTGLLPFAAAHGDRFHDVGIAEQHAVTFAAGLAAAGLRPVVALYSTFLNRAFDQALLDVALHGLPVVFALDRAGITGDDGPSHHGVLDLSLLLRIPGMRVLAPATAADLRSMLLESFDLGGPVAIRYPKGVAEDTLPVGAGTSATCLGVGRDVAILGVGRMVAPAVAAAAELDRRGISCSVWDVRSVAPLDDAMLDDAAIHPLVVTIEDGMIGAGAGGVIRDGIDLRRPISPANVITLGTPCAFLAHGVADDIRAAVGLDANGIVRAVEQCLATRMTP